MTVATLSGTLPAVPIAEPKTYWFKATRGPRDESPPEKAPRTLYPSVDDPEGNETADYDDWRWPARKLWKVLQGEALRTGSQTILLPVWRLAQLCGRGIRWVFYALRMLRELGKIRRVWWRNGQEAPDGKGHHGEACLATQIVVDLAGPEPKAKPAAKAKGKPDAKAPSPGSTGALDAMRADWARAQAEAETASPGEPAAAPKPPAPPAKEPDRHGWVKRLVASVAAGPPHGEDPDPDRTAVLKKRQLDQLEATRADREAEMAARQQKESADPSGPGVPAPESGS
jgi:hypothetical protein